jgi:outer membrane protein
MKSLKSLVAVAAIAVTALSATAQTAPKILTVDLAKLFDNHWKTKEQMAKLQADEAKAQDQLAAITKDGNALVEQFKEADEQSKNPTATADAKAKAQAEAQKLYDQIQAKRQEQNQFVQSTRNAIQQRSQTFKTMMVDDLTTLAVGIAKAKGATILIDKSGPTMSGVSAILYADPSLDITDEVAAKINADRPAVTSAPTTTTPSTSTPTPTATGTSPQITVPGISK